MSQNRRDWGSLDDARKVGLWLEASARARLAELATAAGVSKSEMAQWLIESVDLDEHGRPARWQDLQEELPLKSA